MKTSKRFMAQLEASLSARTQAEIERCVLASAGSIKKRRIGKLGYKWSERMRRAAKTDTNQKPIVAALRGVGATVRPLHAVGRGVPDLLVGFRGTNYLLEVKGRRGRLTADQVTFFDEWRGAAQVVRSVDDALRVIGAI